MKAGHDAGKAFGSILYILNSMVKSCKEKEI